MLEVLCCAEWREDAGAAVAEAGAPGLPVASPSTLSYLASSASLAHADAKMFYGCRFKKQTMRKNTNWYWNFQTGWVTVRFIIST